MIEYIMKNVLLISITTVIIIICFLINNDEKIAPVSATTDSTMEDVSIIHKKNSNTVWSAHITKISRTTKSNNNDNIISLSEINLRFKASNKDNNNLILYAKSGYYDTLNGSIRLTDDITANFNDFKITAKTIDWDNENLILRSNGGVKIIGNRFSVTGDSLYTLKDFKIRLDGNVLATFI